MSLAYARTNTSPHETPVLLPGNQGPFREADLLAIGGVLVAVLVILGWRRFVKIRG